MHLYQTLLLLLLLLSLLCKISFWGPGFIQWIGSREVRRILELYFQKAFSSRDTDVHTVASLLKLYLRDLPEPVVPWSQYDGFLLCGQLMNSDEAKVCMSLE